VFDLMMASLEKKADTCRHLLNLMLHNKFCCVWLIYLISFNTCKCAQRGWTTWRSTMSFCCPMQSYVHNPLLCKQHHDASYFLSLLVSNLWLNVTHSTMSLCCPMQT